MTNKIIATTTKNLQEIIQLEIKMNGNSCDLNHIDVFRITDMSRMFCGSQFNGDLTKWLPYSLLTDEYAFNGCKAPRPYWANFDNLIDRNDAISKYFLYSKLNSKLHIKENSTKKHKI